MPSYVPMKEIQEIVFLWVLLSLIRKQGRKIIQTESICFLTVTGSKLESQVGAELHGRPVDFKKEKKSHEIFYETFF